VQSGPAGHETLGFPLREPAPSTVSYFARQCVGESLTAVKVDPMTLGEAGRRRGDHSRAPVHDAAERVKQNSLISRPVEWLRRIVISLVSLESHRCSF
jgi:hypothetical protein